MSDAQEFLRIFCKRGSPTYGQSDVPARSLSNFLEHGIQYSMYPPSPFYELGFDMVSSPEDRFQK